MLLRRTPYGLNTSLIKLLRVSPYALHKIISGGFGLTRARLGGGFEHTPWGFFRDHFVSFDGTGAELMRPLSRLAPDWARNLSKTRTACWFPQDQAIFEAKI